jgi:hypothetical protein
MALNVECPVCGDHKEVSETLLGQRIKCRLCDALFEVAEPSEDQPQPLGLVDEKAGGFPIRKTLFAIVRGTIWAICLCWTGVAILIYFAIMGQAKSAIHETEAAAGLAAWVIVGYVIARSLDRIFSQIEDVINKRKG